MSKADAILEEVLVAQGGFIHGRLTTEEKGNRQHSDV